MPTISGNVFFSNTRVANSGSAIANVPIILQDTTTGVGLVVLTSSTGAYSFTNVPAGTYTIVEGWGTTGGIPTTGDFSTAVVIPAATPKDPPVSSVTSPPAGTNVIDSITPNTLNVTVAATNITARNFTDAPRKDVPFLVNDITLIGGNLITDANNGDWGTLPAGSPVNTVPATAPYPANVPDFTYIAGAPVGGQYTVNNITSGFNASWWNFANHTTGDETGRFQVVNGAPAGYQFFTSTVSVLPNTNYLFSSWFANMVKVNGFPAGAGILITDSLGNVIFSTGSTTISSSASLLVWTQIGSFFNSGNNTSLNVIFRDVNGGVSGNDYAVDDFSLIQAQVDNILSPLVKTVDKSTTTIGDVLTYTVVITNSGVSTCQNLQFIDTIPNGTTFLPNSFSINGVTSTKNPSPPNGTTLPNMGPGAVTTLVFKVNVVSTPNPNPIPNSAVLNYAFSPVVGSTATLPLSIVSNIVETNYSNVNLGPMSKSVSENYGTVGDTITYTMEFTNTGSDTATNILFSDTIPNGTSFVSNSFTVDGVVQSGANPTPPGTSLADIPVGVTTTITFQVLVNSVPSPNPTTNQAKLNYNSINITLPKNTLSNIVATTINFANLSSSKIVNTAYSTIGKILTYTIPIVNTGNTIATSVLFIDTIPAGTALVANSLKQDGVIIAGSPNPPGVTLNSISAGKTSTITFQVTITTLPIPNPIPNSANATYSYTIDPTTIPSTTGNGATNTNIVTTLVNFANISPITKSVDKIYATCGDVLTYTIVLPNNGTTTAVNVHVTDTIPNGTVFVPNSFTIDGITQAGSTPLTGVTIPSIGAGASSTITFKVTVTC